MYVGSVRSVQVGIYFELAKSNVHHFGTSKAQGHGIQTPPQNWLMWPDNLTALKVPNAMFWGYDTM
jgi:hypothetical protein